MKYELADMATDQATMEEAFAAPMSFGTAGMRGVLGAGIGRMNVFTVRQATEGLARYIDTLSVEAKHAGVAISYDSRYMSQEFAYESARCLGRMIFAASSSTACARRRSCLLPCGTCTRRLGS